MNKRGMILISAYLVIAALLILGTAFMSRSISEKRLAEREKDAIKALYIAEAGIERALDDLKQEFIGGGADPWYDDNDINGNIVDSSNIDADGFYFLNTGASFGGEDGNYAVKLKDVAGKTDEIWVRSTGTYGSITAANPKTIQVYVRIQDLSVWDDVIFCGAGASGSAISGNVLIRGSVHILGTGLLPTDAAIDLTGSASMGNNYAGMSAAISSRIPALPTVVFNGETVESLGATLRIKNGRVDLSGSALVGSTDVSGNSVKETFDGIYINVGPYDGDDTPGSYYDGFGGNAGSNNVNSDNGTVNAYDLGDIFSFPSYSSIEADLATIGYYSISEDVVGTINSSTPDFNYGDANGSINWTQATGILSIGGIIKVIDGADGDSDGEISLGEKNFTIQYTGQGTIVSDDVEIHGDLLSQGMFPAVDRLGFIASDDIELATGGGDSQLKIIAAFYAADKITSAKQNEIAGAFVANYFDMGSNTPKIYEVPTLKDYLPPGMDFSDQDYVILTSNWQEL